MPRPLGGHPADELARFRSNEERYRRTRFSMSGHYFAHGAKVPKQITFTVPDITDTTSPNPGWRPARNIRVIRIQGQSHSNDADTITVKVWSADEDGLVDYITGSPDGDDQTESWNNSPTNRQGGWWHPYTHNRGRVGKTEWIKAEVTGSVAISVVLTIEYVEY